AFRKRVVPPAKTIVLGQFADWIGKLSGLNVILDRSELYGAGIPLDHPISFEGIRSMTLRSLVNHVLSSVWPRLAIVPSDGVLHFTTMSAAESSVQTRLYPVADLVHGARPVDPALLANADLDLRQAAIDRLERKLDQRMSVDFVDLGLMKALS